MLRVIKAPRSPTRFCQEKAHNRREKSSPVIFLTGVAEKPRPISSVIGRLKETDRSNTAKIEKKAMLSSPRGATTHLTQV